MGRLDSCEVPKSAEEQRPIAIDPQIWGSKVARHFASRHDGLPQAMRFRYYGKDRKLGLHVIYSCYYCDKNYSWSFGDAMRGASFPPVTAYFIDQSDEEPDWLDEDLAAAAIDGKEKKTAENAAAFRRAPTWYRILAYISIAAAWIALMGAAVAISFAIDPETSFIFMDIFVEVRGLVLLILLPIGVISALLVSAAIIQRVTDRGYRDLSDATG